ncbi:hypothetical protein PVAND_008895 [Polypedilum vanderplanki]|uniref:Uncharacterized protein n=1 Tax=Polypedilum vanderplanki TaxID=319348 RepID=A0A9J6CB82_POLVA|nr:hypothetical protein PVAND_008895 [Polypedilum vanderplanki]
MASLTTISWTVADNANDAVSHALFAGYTSDGKKVYVGRAVDENGNPVPAKIIPEFNKTFYEENGNEKSTDNIEYLFHNEGYEWLRSSNGKVVPDAVNLNDYYVGRAEIDGTTVVGKVDLKEKKLFASYNGKTVSLSDYDVLTFKPQTNKTRFQSSVSQERYQNSVNIRSDAISSIISGRYIQDNSYQNQQKFFELQNKIQTLELELANYKNERKNYEQRISFEQKRVQDLSKQIQSMKIENSVFTSERSTYEERIVEGNSKLSDLELRLQDVLNENSFLLKKITTLEETLKSERYQMEIYTEKYKSSQSSPGNMMAKIKSFEERIKSQQQRIFELESIIENSNADSDSLKSQLTSYESTIEHQKIQVESILKKLQAANADNEFLVKKLALLTQTLRNYQFEMESMTAQLQNAKAIIASLHTELARSNGQLSKYQAALSNSYVLNGELMTKVSGLNTLSQYSSSTESKFDILQMSLSSMEANAKAYTYNTPSLLEATNSETFTKYLKVQSSETSSENGFTPYKVSTEPTASSPEPM